MKRLLALLTLLISGYALGQTGNTITLRFPGVPSGGCALIMFAVNNATGDLYDCLAGSWNLVTGGGGGSGTVSANAGIAGAGAYYPAAAGSTTVSPLTGLSYDSVGNASIAQGTLAGASTPFFSHTATWNNAATAFNGYFTNTTCTASAAGSKLFDYQVGATSVLDIRFNVANCASGTLHLPAAGSGVPNVAVQGQNTSGLQFSGDAVRHLSSGTAVTVMQSVGLNVGSAKGYGFSSNTNPAVANPDTGIGRSAAGVVSADTSTAGNGLGTFIATAYQTKTNCSASGTAANPSVVACAAAASGAVYCDVASSAGTCTINTTAVTANSNIQFTWTASANTRLSQTCNTSPTFGAVPTVAAIVAGTSFTVNMPTVVTNGACGFYTITN